MEKTPIQVKNFRIYFRVVYNGRSNDLFTEYLLLSQNYVVVESDFDYNLNIVETLAFFVEYPKL